MRFLLSPDSYKDSLSATDVCDIMATAIRKAMPQAVIDSLPLADGGEGTLEAVIRTTGAKRITLTVADPLNRPTSADYAIIDGTTAFIEMAQASGLEKLQIHERNPLLTTTFGTGQLIRDALDKGIRTIIVSIGGSATVDGGSGMMQALGLKLFDEHNSLLPPCGEALLNLAHIDSSQLDSRLASCTVTVACDVTNPLCGPSGAAAVFGPQKGATPAIVTQLEQGLSHWALLLHEDGTTPGDGAAGGMGFALRVFARAVMQSGAAIVASLAHFQEHLDKADIVFTGEGRSDSQTLHGKLPSFVASQARRANKPCILVSGAVSGPQEDLKKAFTAVFSTVPDVRPLTDILATSRQSLADCMDAVIALITLGNNA